MTESGKSGLKLKFKKPPKKEREPCTFCHSKEHDSGACPALSWCDRCGEKGHFPKNCPHHTESEEMRALRRTEEKKNWSTQVKKSAKSDRTQRSWSRGHSLTSSDDDESCPIPPIPRPFTEEEKMRAEERRKWFAAKEAKKKKKELERKLREEKDQLHRKEPNPDTETAPPSPPPQSTSKKPSDGREREPTREATAEARPGSQKPAKERGDTSERRKNTPDKSTPKETSSHTAVSTKVPESRNSKNDEPTSKALTQKDSAKPPASAKQPKRSRSSSRSSSSSSGSSRSGSGSGSSGSRRSRDDGRRNPDEGRTVRHPSRTRRGSSPTQKEKEKQRSASSSHRRQPSPQQRRDERPKKRSERSRSGDRRRGSRTADRSARKPKPTPRESPERKRPRNEEGRRQEHNAKKIPGRSKPEEIAAPASPSAASVPAVEKVEKGDGENETQEVALSAHQKLLLSNPQYQKKVKAQSDFFLCPNWAMLPEEGLRLEVLKAGQRFPPLEIDRSPYYLFGRGQGVVDFLVEHPSTSRVHLALIHGAKKQVFVYDLGSKAGSRVDGKPLPPKQPVALSEGSMLTLGDSTRAYILRRRSLWEKDDK